MRIENPFDGIEKFGSFEFQDEIKNFRDELIKRNLYHLGSGYVRNEDRFSPDNTNYDSQIAHGIMSTVAPLKSLSGVMNIVGHPTNVQMNASSKIVEVGRKQYAIHMLYNTTNQLTSKTFPSIDVGGAIRGGDLIKSPKDFAITSPSSNWFARAGISIGESILSNNPMGDITSGIQRKWKEIPDGQDLLDFTGKGQLEFLYENLNRNTFVSEKISEPTGVMYRQGFRGWRDYGYYYKELDGVLAADFKQILFVEGDTPPRFGDNKPLFGYDEYENIFKSDDDEIVSTDDRIIWGVESTYNKRIGDSGILKTTEKLLSTYEDEIVDQVRKVFKNNKKIIGYAGSPLFYSNESKYAKKTKELYGHKGDTGVDIGLRQHTIDDPYTGVGDRGKRKLIRYVGNRGYNSDSGAPNVDSVIYKTVLPKLHPTLEDRNSDEKSNRNLMLSIENLAVEVRDGGEFGLMDDEYGTPVHWSEIGPMGGRLMWFPPYNLTLNETSNAKYESTVMIGRGEPMYNYMNTERGLNLGFTLLIDHPEQLKLLNEGVNKDRNDFNKRAAEFFAFGGDSIPVKENFKEITDRQTQINESVVENHYKKEVRIYFSNMRPNVNSGDNLNIFFDKLYKWGYEVNRKYKLSKITAPTHSSGVTQTGLGNGRNDTFYNNTELISDDNNASFYVDIDNYVDGFQYEIERDENDNLIGGSNNSLNEELMKFKTEIGHKNRIKITISSGASKHGESDFNKKLSEWRAEATKQLIVRRLQSIDVDYEDIIFDTSVYEGDSHAGGDPKLSINDPINVEDRFAMVIFETIDTTTQTEEEAVGRVKKTISFGTDVMKERTEPFMNKFLAFKKNQYYPAFHTQTPSDFHKRLTFLHQCTRQGQAKDGGNSVFGRQPICVLRIGDFFYSKVVIETLTIDYEEAPWDLNPEGMGVQPMLANINLQIKVIGGQSLKGPIDSLQNAVSFNYYANSTFRKDDEYLLPYTMGEIQDKYRKMRIDEEKNSTIDKEINKLLEPMKIRNQQFDEEYEDYQKRKKKKPNRK